MLQSLYESGRVADLLLILVAVEAAGLVWLHRRVGRSGIPWGLLLNLLTGAALVAALGAALKGLAWTWVAAGLVAALVGHVADLLLRWRTTGPSRNGPTS